jgi:hypothetical protein
MLAMSGDARPGSEDFRFPCRFPAKPPIIAERHEQVYDRTEFFGIGEAAKKNFPGFSLCGREREAALPRARFRCRLMAKDQAD